MASRYTEADVTCVEAVKRGQDFPGLTYFIVVRLLTAPCSDAFVTNFIASVTCMTLRVALMKNNLISHFLGEQVENPTYLM